MKYSFLSLAFCAFTLTGCGASVNDASSSTTDSPTTASQTETAKSIVTSFYPLAFMVEEIVKDKAQVTNLAGASDVHDYEPSPQDIVKLNEADLVVYQGASLEIWAENIMPTLEGEVLEVSQNLELTKFENHESHHDEEAHDEHNHGEYDPHTWLDPVLATQMVEAITNAIINIDPDNQAFYQVNANALKKRFTTLAENFENELNQCATREVIVSHGAYGYLAQRYNFEMHAIAGLSTQDEPSAQILAELKDEAAEGLTHLLIEENNVRRFAETLAVETGLAVLPINPLSQGTLDPNKDFFDVMEENLQSFKTALNCQ